MASALRQQTANGTWTALENIRCGKVSILNSSGADLEIRHIGDTGNKIVLADGQTAALTPVHTSAEFEIKGAGTANIIIG